MRKKVLLAALALVFALALVVPASAITWGTPDGEAHPYVGLLIFDVGGRPAWRCSGTLLSPTVMLTAGDCTYGATGGRVWFQSDVMADPGSKYPFAGGTSIEFAEIHTHPQYNDAAFFLHDTGIVILSQPVNRDWYPTLAPVGLLDQLATKRGLQEQTFTAVGYGVQEIVPNPNEERADLIRYQATTKMIGVKGTFGIPDGVAVVLTNNPGQPHQGGTCFGDSGGPIFWNGDGSIAAVTSFGVNPNCVGNGGGYRIDTTDDQDWIKDFLR